MPGTANKVELLTGMFDERQLAEKPLSPSRRDGVSPFRARSTTRHRSDLLKSRPSSEGNSMTDANAKFIQNKGRLFTCKCLRDIDHYP